MAYAGKRCYRVSKLKNGLGFC